MDGQPVVPTPKELRSMLNSVEALYNLVYLMREEADRPEKVPHYAEFCSTPLNMLRSTLEKIR
jgi:hypothetical protein